MIVLPWMFDQLLTGFVYCLPAHLTDGARIDSASHPPNPPYFQLKFAFHIHVYQHVTSWSGEIRHPTIRRRQRPGEEPGILLQTAPHAGVDVPEGWLSGCSLSSRSHTCLKFSNMSVGVILPSTAGYTATETGRGVETMSGLFSSISFNIIFQPSKLFVIHRSRCVHHRIERYWE